MDPVTAMAIAQGVVGLGKSIFGGIQKNRAKRERDRLLADQPQFDTPQSIQDLSALYGQYLSDVQRREGIPGQQQIEANIRESAATGIQKVRETARSSTEALGATTDIIGRELEGIQQLEIEAARQKARQELNAMQMYGQALGGQAQYEQQEFMYNEYMPWQTQVAQAQAEYAGGQQTMVSGLSDVVSGATQFGVNQAYGSQRPPEPWVPDPLSQINPQMDTSNPFSNIPSVGQQMNPGANFYANSADFNARLGGGYYDIPTFNF
jgi:hypothetical protein